jgi:hypothetical protein
MAVDDEQGPDQVIGGQDIFPHQAARPFRLAVAARADDQIERWGGGRLWPRCIAHFDRTPEFDRHGFAFPEAAGLDFF